MAKSRFKLVLIEWIDSEFAELGWRDLGELAGSKTGCPPVCQSVGWLISESGGRKTIVSSLDGDNPGAKHGAGGISIINKAVVRVKVLRP